MWIVCTNLVCYSLVLTRALASTASPFESILHGVTNSHLWNNLPQSTDNRTNSFDRIFTVLGRHGLLHFTSICFMLLVCLSNVFVYKMLFVGNRLTNRFALLDIQPKHIAFKRHHHYSLQSKFFFLLLLVYCILHMQAVASFIVVHRIDSILNFLLVCVCVTSERVKVEM